MLLIKSEIIIFDFYSRSIIEKNNYKMALIGGSYDGVGINDAIMSSKVQVEKFVNNFC